MSCYHHLTPEQRAQLYESRLANVSQAEIARCLGVSASTITRELQRNSGGGGYRPSQADKLARARWAQAAKRARFTLELQARVEAYLRQDYSPAQASAQLKLTDGLSISPTRIYQHIWTDQKAGGDLYTHLRCACKKRRKCYGKPDGRGQIVNRVSIEQRPPEVDAKQRLGDWEGDLILGAGRKGAVVTLTERVTKLTLMGRVAAKKAAPVAETIMRLLKPYQPHVLSITFDNGKEFAHHAEIARQLNAAVFFAHPYQAWERGLNENTNGLIRQYIPKNMPIDDTIDAKIPFITERLNLRPRKTLNWKNPAQVFYEMANFNPVALVT